MKIETCETPQMEKQLLFLVALLAFVQGQTDEGQCIWTGLCGPHPDYPLFKCLNCAYPGPAQEIDSSLHPLLDDVCPHIRFEKWQKTVFSITVSSDFRHEMGENPKLCCDEKQLVDLSNNFQLAEGFLGERCPTSYYNFRYGMMLD